MVTELTQLHQSIKEVNTNLKVLVHHIHPGHLIKQSQEVAPEATKAEAAIVDDGAMASKATPDQTVVPKEEATAHMAAAATPQLEVAAIPNEAVVDLEEAGAHGEARKAGSPKSSTDDELIVVKQASVGSGDQE